MPSPEHEQWIADRLAGLPQGGSIGDAREDFEQLLARTPPVASSEILTMRIGSMAADWIVAGGEDAGRNLLYLHGGAYMLGSNVAYRGFGSRIAAACKSSVLVPDYRLAPEHVFPAALEDAVSAYRWLTQEVDPSTILVAGDSAGGGLAVSMMVALRDAGERLPRCAVLFSPWTDLSCSGESHKPGVVDDPFFTAEVVRLLGQNYAGERTMDPGASPLFANLEGLPPMLAFAGSREILMDDATRLVDRAYASGVDARAVVEPGLMHAWPVYDLPESRQCLIEAGRFVDAVFAK